MCRGPLRMQQRNRHGSVLDDAAATPAPRRRPAWSRQNRATAKVLAQTTAYQLIRLQCYEGLDEAKALYEWEYSKQLLYVQMLKDKFGTLLAATTSLNEAVSLLQRHTSAFFSQDFLLPRPLLQAILSPHPTVLLIDEVDRADQEFEAFLLEVLSDFQVSIPELAP